jgi:hypothetical protein
MDGVMDSRLVGYWSDKNLYQGGMKAADIAFRPDGKGWAEGSNAAYGFVILRFTWHAAERRQLTLHLCEELSGTWHWEGRTLRYRVTSRHACDTKIVLAYKIRRGRDALGRPATLLEAGQRISPGEIGDRFAFERELGRHERDPAVRRSRRP